LVLSGQPQSTWLDQDSLLRELWAEGVPQDKIAERLNRTVAAIMTRAVRLGLPRRASPGRKPGFRQMGGGLRQRPSKKAVAATTKAERDAKMAADLESAKRSNPEAAERICLMCLRKFLSEGRHNRICPTCKSGVSYAAACGLPEMNFKVET
jgi:hypothetical protein